VLHKRTGAPTGVILGTFCRAITGPLRRGGGAIAEPEQVRKSKRRRMPFMGFVTVGKIYMYI
jgi:hypothetical protein